MKFLIENLTDEQREIFEEVFYDVWEFDDKDTTSPYGCPWYWNKKDELIGETVEECAKNFYNLHRNKILECIKNDIENQGKMVSNPLSSFKSDSVIINDDSGITPNTIPDAIIWKIPGEDDSHLIIFKVESMNTESMNIFNEFKEKMYEIQEKKNEPIRL